MLDPPDDIAKSNQDYGALIQADTSLEKNNAHQNKRKETYMPLNDCDVILMWAFIIVKDG